MIKNYTTINSIHCCISKAKIYRILINLIERKSPMPLKEIHDYYEYSSLYDRKILSRNSHYNFKAQ